MTTSITGQNLNGIDYSWNNPLAYTAFVPVLSLLMQQKPALIEPSLPNNLAAVDAASRRYVHYCRWNLAGACAQLFACAAAINIFAMPIFALLAIPASGQFLETFVDCLQRVWVCDFSSGTSSNTTVFGQLLNVYV